MTQQDPLQTDYSKYRGKCKELSEAACAANPSLMMIRGHYFCPIWNTQEAHWWCEDKHGNITDPSKNQFPSKGLGEYVAFDGTMECAECGKTLQEHDAVFESSYAFCSTRCLMKFVGL